MSTRATYRFSKSDDWMNVNVTLYHHHDGYLSGAGLLFSNAMGGGKKLTAESFLRSNSKAEITVSHEFHGDTEYRYDIDEHSQSVRVSERNMEVYGMDLWEELGTATIKRFVEVVTTEDDHISAIRELRKLLKSDIREAA